jgi:hypothetical protein
MIGFINQTVTGGGHAYFFHSQCGAGSSPEVNGAWLIDAFNPM